MSVFTPVSTDEARALLEHYSLGELERLEGIAQGVENTNYFLTTTIREYVLTLFEHIDRADLPFFVGLMEHLATHEVSCPLPMHRDDGGLLSEVNGKPAVIVTRIPGAPDMHPSPAACRRAGEILASIHVAGVEFDGSLENSRGRAWRESFAQAVGPHLPAAERELIEQENAYQALFDDSVLPVGIIHGDYFRDNVLWADSHHGGVIDFYFACDDILLYDVAIAVNDWCVNPDATLDTQRVHAFVSGYEVSRPLERLEREMWPAMLRRAALRTWLGRLGYNYFPRESHMTIPKDHAFSKALFEHHASHARALAATLD